MTKPAKVQALAAIKILQEKQVIKLERSQMRLRVSLVDLQIIAPKGAAAKIKSTLEGEGLVLIDERFEDNWVYDCLGRATN